MNEDQPSSRTAAAAGDRLLTLSEIAAETGISLDDLARYRQRHGDRIPSVETGERRRYPEAAVVMFRALHRRAGGSDHEAADERGDEGGGRRRLLSLSAQRRRKDEEKRRQREKLAAEPVVDPGPPDPMIAALEALSGADGAETVLPTARQEEPEPDETGETDGTDGAETAAAHGGPRDERPPSAGSAPAPPWETETTAAFEPAAEPEEESGEEAAEEETVVRTVVRHSRPQPERRAPARPSRPVYTLQQVHERTGIPYAKLALYAASHADQIPSVGERRSPAYMREGMEAFCRLHALKEPGWEIPDLGPEPGWDDARGLAARLEALESTQRTVADQLRTTVHALRRTWTGEATWE